MGQLVREVAALSGWSVGVVVDDRPLRAGEYRDRREDLLLDFEQVPDSGCLVGELGESDDRYLKPGCQCVWIEGVEHAQPKLASDVCG